MKKHFYMISTLVFIIIVMVGCSKHEFPYQNDDNGNKNISIGIKESSTNNDIITNEQKEKIKTWTSILSDVNGDGLKEKVELVGLSNDEISNEYCPGKLTLTIQDSSTGIVLGSRQVFDDSGFTPELKVADLNYDNANDILVEMDPRGNGYDNLYYSLYSFKKNEFKEIPLADIGMYDKHIHYNLNEGNDLSLYIDGIQKKVLLPITKEQKDLFKKNADKPIYGYFPGVVYNIIDYDKDGEYELECTKMFCAEYKSNIAFLDIIYKWTDKSWLAVKADVRPI